MKSFVHLLLSVLFPATLVGVLVGFVLGWHYIAAGFPLLVLGALRQGLMITLGVALVFVLLHEPIRRLLAGLLKGRLAPFALPLAAGLAATPFVALAGYRLNRARAIRPSEIFESYALIPNLQLLAGCFVLYLLVVFWLRSRPAEPPTSWRPLVGWQPLVWQALVSIGLLAAVQLSVFGLYRAGDKPKPDVLVLLVDALRADHLSSYGYHRETSPAIDSLARDGVLFRQAIAQSTFTKTSIASLFTGLYPHGHGIYWGQRQLPNGDLVADLLGASAITLAEVMKANGYLTAAWVQNSHLRRVMGFSQGFVDYHDQQGSIERIHDRFLPWYRGPGKRYNSFVYLHYIDLHDPYLPKPPYDTLFATQNGAGQDGVSQDVYEGVNFDQWGAHLKAIREGKVSLSENQVEQLRALYDGQLRAIDDQIGLLLDELRASGRYDDTLIVLTADHGDAFMEHGFISHSTAPYDELVRVPLIVKLPKGRHAGRQIDAQVRLVDLMPTLLAATRSSKRRPEKSDGCNLMPWIELGDRPEEERPACDFAVTEIAEEDDEPPTLAVRTERYKYIYREKGQDELYDLLEDPGELQNMASSELSEETRPLRTLALYLASLRNTEGINQTKVKGQLRKELEAMGYI